MLPQERRLVAPSDAAAVRDVAVKQQRSEVNSGAVAASNGSGTALALKWIGGGVVLLLLVGGLIFLIQDQGSGLTGDNLTKNQLKGIFLAYSDYEMVNVGKAPGKTEDLHPFFHGEVFPPEAGKADRDCYQAIQDGKLTVVWGVKDFRNAKEGEASPCV